MKKNQIRARQNRSAKGSASQVPTQPESTSEVKPSSTQNLHPGFIAVSTEKLDQLSNALFRLDDIANRSAAVMHLIGELYTRELETTWSDNRGGAVAGGTASLFLNEMRALLDIRDELFEHSRNLKLVKG